MLGRLIPWWWDDLITSVTQNPSIYQFSKTSVVWTYSLNKNANLRFSKTFVAEVNYKRKKKLKDSSKSMTAFTCCGKFPVVRIIFWQTPGGDRHYSGHWECSSSYPYRAAIPVSTAIFLQGWMPSVGLFPLLIRTMFWKKKKRKRNSKYKIKSMYLAQWDHQQDLKKIFF